MIRVGRIFNKLKSRTRNFCHVTRQVDRFFQMSLCISCNKVVYLATQQQNSPTDTHGFLLIQSYGLTESKRPFSSQHNPTFRDLELVVASNRVTAVVNQALSLGSTKLKDAFYNGNIRLNGKRLIKKTTKVSLADTIDVVLELLEDEVVLQRVLVLSEGEETLKGKYRYRVRCWKRLVVPRVQS